MSIHRVELKGGKVRYRVRFRDDAGAHSRTFPTEKAAKRFEAERELEASSGAFGRGVPSKQFVLEYLVEWYERERSGWAKSTQLTREGVAAKWVEPFIPERMRLCNFGEKAVRDWHVSIRAAGCPPTQQRAAASLLSSALGAAVKSKLIPYNPCSALDRPTVAVKRPRTIPVADVERLRAAMPRQRDAVLVSLLCYAGLRVGEALALSWDAVDLERRRLIVEQNYVHGELKPTKTGRIRTVDLCRPLVDDLAAVRPEAPAPRSFVSRSRQGGGGPLDRHNWTNRVWSPAAESIGLEATPGDGRHTFASLLANAGEPVIYIAGQLGHTMTRTTELYSHELGPDRMKRGVPMEVAILAARRDLAGSAVQETCNAGGGLKVAAR